MLFNTHLFFVEDEPYCLSPLLHKPGKSPCFNLDLPKQEQKSALRKTVYACARCSSEASQGQLGSILGVFSVVFQVITAFENTFTRVTVS